MQKALPMIGVLSQRTEGAVLPYYRTTAHYIEQLEAAGGIPVQLPVTRKTDTAQLERWIALCDGLLLPGGGDLPCELYGEKRLAGQAEPDADAWHGAETELALIRLAASAGLPMLGICLGEQALNVAFGGTLYQDIPTQYPSETEHDQPAAQRARVTHTVRVEKESLLYALVQRETLWVNTFHHQAVKTPAPGFMVSATAEDGLAEAIEWPEKRILGVQWHPENLADAGQCEAKALFAWLVQHAGGESKA